MAIRSQQGGAGVFRVIPADRRVDEHFQTRLHAHLNHFLADVRRQYSLIVILEADDIHPLQGLAVPPEQLVIDVVRQRVGALLVNPHELLPVTMLRQADESLLGGRGTVRDLAHTGDVRPDGGQTLAERRAVGVLTRYADTDRRGAQRCQIGRDRRRAAAAGFRLRHFQNGNRRLRADPHGVAVHVDVEHEIAGDENLRCAKVPYCLEQSFVHVNHQPVAAFGFSTGWPFYRRGRDQSRP